MKKTHKFSENFKLFISNTKVIRKRLIDTYWIFFGFRSLINISLQCIYVQLQRSLDNTFKLDKKREINNTIEQIRNLMLFIGQPHRETGTSGIFHYSIIIYSWIIFYFFERLLKDKNLSNERNEGLLCYLENPAKERKIISSRIEETIKKLTESNINFTKIMLNNQQNSSSSYKSLSSQVFIDRKISIEFQSSQLEQLNKLKFETSRIWPTNRVSNWANKIRKSWFKLYISSYVNIWLICVIVVSLSLINSHNALTASNLNENYTKFNLLDRLWSVDMLLYCSIASSWYAESLSVTIISVYDQLKLVNDFKSILPHVRSRINKLNYLENRNKQISSTRNMEDFNSDKVKIQEFKIECDNAIVEFYILFKLFKDDLRNTLELTQTTVGEIVTLIITTILTTLCFYDQIPDDQITIVSVATIVMMLSVNCAFLLCAALHASSCHIIDLVWPLINLAETYNLTSFLSQSLEIKGTSTKKAAKFLSFGQSNSGLEFDINFDYEYYSHSLIAPHTVFLLRKIAANHAFLARDCVCRLYGSIPLDYRGIMRANFWLISSILLSLTYYS